MKKILLSLLVMGSLYAGDTFNLKNAILGDYGFSTTGFMGIRNPQTGETINIPVEINSKTDKVKKNGKGFKISNSTSMTIKLPNGREQTENVYSTVITDEYYRTLSLSEESSSQNKKAICKVDKISKIDTNFNKEIGFKSEVETLTCDNGSSRSIYFELKSGKNNSGDLHIHMVQDSPMMVATQEVIINLEKNGHLNSIDSFLHAENLFDIKFKAIDIKQ